MPSRTTTKNPTRRTPAGTYGRATRGKGVAPARPATPANPGRREKWQPSESRSVRSGWGWRGFLMLTLVAIGVAIIMAGNHHGTLAILWLVIAVGWLFTSMWLWRQHSRYMRD